MRLLKPMFVPKSDRDTVAEREQLELEEERAIEVERKRLELRKLETRQILVETLANVRRVAGAGALGHFCCAADTSRLDSTNACCMHSVRACQLPFVSRLHVPWRLD